MKNLRGYVASRPFMGERAAQHIQNIMLRDYCNKMKAKYLLSGTEYAMKDSYLMLNELVREIPKIDGIVAFSLFQLPEDKFLRSGIYEEILLRGGELHFALEGLRITNNTEINRIENIWIVRQTLPSCSVSISTG
jgi:sporadic carbohydrate cluster protein (TIGR04323 family)